MTITEEELAEEIARLALKGMTRTDISKYMELPYHKVLRIATTYIPKSLFKKGITHGTVTGYRYHGCKCEPCRIENNRYTTETRRKRTARLPSGVNHGLRSTYTNWGCRCDPCKAAGKVYNDRYYYANRKNTLQATDLT